MTEEKKSSRLGCWLWAIALVVVICLGAWVYTNDTAWNGVTRVYGQVMAWAGIGQSVQPTSPSSPVPGPVTGLPPTAGVPPDAGAAALPPGPEPAQAPPAAPEVGAQPESHDGALAPGTIALQAPEAAARPTGVLKACIGRLSQDDLIGAEQYVTPNGLAFKRGDTAGAHIVLWKALYGMRAYDEVGYGDLKVSGQTAWVPVYSHIGNNKLIGIYVVMANRGDGWKLDCLVDPKKY